MTVTLAKGFVAGAVHAGLKKSGKLDLALVVNQGPLNSAAVVFTTNRCQANPIIWSKEVIKDGQVSAIILNSGGANCYTGAQGFQTTHATAEKVAEELGVSAGDVLVCSTGLIGDQLDREKLLAGTSAVAANLNTTNGAIAAQAIMTTDSKPKTAEFTHADGWSIGGMAKGAGMLAPGLATMLVVITTDASLDSKSLDQALRAATRVTFDRLDSDGCMSTNDQVTLMASGASNVTPSQDDFTVALTQICISLATQLQQDAEGSSHDITITVQGAASEADAEEVGRSVARNNLFKAAIYGNDPNWGRILAAVGVTKAQFDPYNIDVSINGVSVSRKGQPDQPRELVDLSPRAVDITINLNSGTHSAAIYTNDLTHEYVTENSEYSS
ncbi:bifunctional glutamate N-acetyltransferase/amino-acid acetyltransferase ArgJ [Rhodoluna lacicola]|jgi:glutamate N-acetyltransferase / amino-acid N-acetyltransferase|uniref:Arginine biosynthesis bifunctional protein ArgJ n=1 Tax=Rhodoluna lacicola TaxID=529884 RepID=A0A060JL40_9MICO|nr:bifunctional glutamate N-acetyltransferase/amino-acid acetyltransferase ArgJ [Rhodoluna lacicola]AIC47318.1 glutamate N-acetyltransferase/amino-acid acetyltransferase [Rhodoluna lacicola]